MSSDAPSKRMVGRYALYDEIAAGGMATVHIGRLLGPVGFSRTVAIKSMHAQYAKDPEFVAMFLDEARLAARIRHPNVVATLDVVALKKEIFLVMDYIQGESLSRLLRTLRGRGTRAPAGIVSSIMVNVLDGLHAAHEATDERGESLHIVHRDVSPHNVMVGRDGIARVLDFGVAKATARAQSTRDGQIKGKFAYMAPEQVTRQSVDRRADVFAASVVLWEALVGERLFSAEEPAAVIARVMNDPIPPPSERVHDVTAEIDAVVLRGLAREREERFDTAEEMARALERALPPARPAEVGQWVKDVAGEVLVERAERIAEIESMSSVAPERDETMPTDLLTPGGALGAEGTHTGLSSATPVTRARSPRVWLGVGAVAVAVAGGSAVFVYQRGHMTTSTTDTASVSVATPAAASTAVDVPVVATAMSPASVPSPESAGAQPSASAATPAVRHHVATVHTNTAVSPTARVDCTPPYTFDEHGVKHFKRECL